MGAGVTAAGTGVGEAVAVGDAVAVGEGVGTVGDAVVEAVGVGIVYGSVEVTAVSPTTPSCRPIQRREYLNKYQSATAITTINAKYIHEFITTISSILYKSICFHDSYHIQCQ